MQIGNGAANVIMSTTDFTFNGVSLLGNIPVTGTWTPTITVTGGAWPATPTYSNMVGKYVKTGASVTIAFNVQMTFSGADYATAAQFYIGGLPFTSSNSVTNYGAIGYDISNAGNNGWRSSQYAGSPDYPRMYLGPGVSQLYFMTIDNRTTVTQPSWLLVGNGTVDTAILNGSMTYITNAI